MLTPEYTDRDWPEDAQHENGNYQNTCCICHEMFIGHKRRVVCRKCYQPKQEAHDQQDPISS